MLSGSNPIGIEVPGLEPGCCGFDSHLPHDGSVAETADARDLKSRTRKGVQVQFLSELWFFEKLREALTVAVAKLADALA